MPSPFPVRLFLSEDSPSKVGLGAQDDLQAKASWLLHSTGTGSDDNLPPGFEGPQSTDQMKIDLSEMPLIKWKCPPRLVLNPHWQVVAGEESKDSEVQNQRNMRVLEAIYPRTSSIPSSPSVSAEVEQSHYDDKRAPLIPITPIEEEDVVSQSLDSVVPVTKLPVLNQNLSSPVSLPSKPPSNEKPALGVVPGAEPDVAAAASAAFAAIMMSNEQGSLIDPDLLIKILSNPKLIEKFLTNCGPPQSNPQPAPPKPGATPINMSVPLFTPPPAPIQPRTPSVNMSGPSSAPPVNMINMSCPLPAPPANMSVPVPLPVLITNPAGPMLRPPPPPPRNLQMPIPVPASKAPPPPMKDLNYYKNLIQQHGGERHEVQDQAPPQFGNPYKNQYPGSHIDMSQNSKPRDSKNKSWKPCMYFNSSRGCKNGVNCGYTHDSSVQQRKANMPEAQSAKRMKFDREITGRS
ncbi:hypothetical protein GIB67_030182 [Kingdonia uniflora]|uniref:C3H1-type domain-containing protein n=1 Tax=Kingdonia uniflora TaxID=39325 RepID=A0A7J7L0R6_9MAGN|nr:hypothetical protein GIB67_030182 [Kingdonia uniflora]